MDLNKCVINGKYSYYCKKTEVIDQKNCVLLGFKDNLPVLGNVKPEVSKSSTMSPKKTLKVQVDSQTGEKFINLNGKKLKMVTESQLPLHLKQHSQIIKSNPANGIVARKPVKIKIIGTMSSILCSSSKIVKSPESQDKDKIVLKPNVYKTDSHIDDTAKLSQKTVLIKENKLPAVSYPSVGKAIVTSTTLVSERVDAKQENGKLGNINQFKFEVKTNGTNNMKALDLTKLNKHILCNPGIVDIKKSDKCVQTDNNSSVTESVQTDVTHPPSDILDLNFDLLDFMNSPSMPDLNNSVNFNLLDLPTTNMKAQQNEGMQMFFNDLRSALQPDDKGNLPIHIGVLSNNINLVKRNCNVLRALQKSVDIPNHGDLTALQLAVINDSSPEILTMLLLNRASLAVTDVEGNNVVHLAVEFERRNLLEIVIKTAVNVGFNLDQFNAEGLTPLMICCCNGLRQCAELLIAHGADVNVRDRKSGRTALFHAAENYDMDMVLLLLRHNADTKIKNFFGTSPHEAMYEVDDIPEQIKTAILGKSAKRKMNEEPRIVKVKRKEEIKKPLRTYARFKKIDYEFPKTNLTTVTQ